MSPPTLTPAQQQALARLKADMASVEYPDKHESGSWFDAQSDQVCLRFLRARDFDYEKARAMLVNHCEWRQSVKPHLVKFSDPDVRKVLMMDEGGSWRYAGRGKLNHPILLSHAARFHPARMESTEGYLKLQIAQHEWFNALLHADPRTNPESGERVDAGIVFLDFTGWSVLDQGSPSGLKFTRILVDVANLHYPETLYKAIVWNASLFMRTVWKVIKPWLAEKTASRVVFVNNPSDLLEYVDASVLLPEYGGTRQEPYPLPV